MALVNGATYRFENRADGRRSLNVYGNSPASLANVCLWTSDDDDICQQWVYKVTGGHAYLFCKGNQNLALDQYTGSGSSTVKNYNAHVYAPSETSYIEVEEISGGYVRIRLEEDPDKYLTANQGSNGTSGGNDVNAAGNVYWYDGGLTDRSQDWEPIRLDGGSEPGPEPGEDDAVTMNGKLMIKSVAHPNYALNVYGTSVAAGRNVCLYPADEDDVMQQWIPQAQGGNVYKLSTAQVGSSKTVLSRSRSSLVNNCIMATSGASGSDGDKSNDQLDQEIQFVKVSGNEYIIYLYNDGAKNRVLTCAGTVSESGTSNPSSLTAAGNVYWASPSDSLEERQRWTVEYLDGTEGGTILPHAQAYVQRDNTWAYLTIPGEFDAYACGVCSLCTCVSILEEDDNYTPVEAREDGVFVYGDLNTNWSNGGLNVARVNNNDLDGACSRIRTEINSGCPVIVRVDKGSFQHFVTAYGLKSGTTASNITPSRILIADPYNPEYTDLQKLLDSCSAGDSAFMFIYVM